MRFEMGLYPAEKRKKIISEFTTDEIISKENTDTEKSEEGKEDKSKSPKKLKIPGLSDRHPKPKGSHYFEIAQEYNPAANRNKSVLGWYRACVK